MFTGAAAKREPTTRSAGRAIPPAASDKESGAKCRFSPRPRGVPPRGRQKTNVFAYSASLQPRYSGEGRFGQLADDWRSL